MMAKYGAVFLIALALYGVSCAPGAAWQDSGLIQYRVWHNDLEGFAGLALSHPLYYLVAIGAKQVPAGEFGHRINLVSAVAAALAVANLYLLVRLWLGRDFPAVIAALSLAVSHTFWWHASVAETYTLWAALFLGELIALLVYARGKRVFHQSRDDGDRLPRSVSLARNDIQPPSMSSRAAEETCLPAGGADTGPIPLMSLRGAQRRSNLLPLAAGLPKRSTKACTAHPTLYLLGLLNGLAIAVHMLAVIPLACYVVFLFVLLVRGSIRARDLALIGALWILGALPLVYLILKNMVQSGAILGTLSSAAFGDRWRAAVLNTSLSWTLIKESLLLPLLNFPTPNFLLFFLGLAALIRTGRTSAFRAILAAMLLLFFLFAFRYTVPDRYAFFLPFYCLVAAVIGLGAHELRARFPHAAVSCLLVLLALVPVGVYAAAPGLAQRWNLSLGTRQDLPYRNDYEYFLRPWRTGCRGAERFARTALEAAEPDAIICADTTTVAPLLYVQEVKDVRPDVKIVASIVRSQGAPRVNEQTVGSLLAQYPVYVVSRQSGYCPAFVLSHYQLTQAGVLWRVVKPVPTSD